MSMDEARCSARMLIALHDAILEADEWDDVPAGVERRGESINAIRSRLKPRIEFDPHNHTVHSDGRFTYRQLAWWCRGVGLPAIGVTDHDNMSPLIGDGIEEAARMGVRMVPGLEVTIHRLGGQVWKGLEVGMHFLPSDRFADFIRTDAGREFCARFEEVSRVKSEQGWGALERVNADMMEPNGLAPITRDELWDGSGRTDPVCPSTLTVIALKRFFDEGRDDLLERFPNTRVIYTHMQTNGLVPPAKAPDQTFDDLIEIRETLGSHGIRSTVTLNHPEEWLSKCGLVMRSGAPNVPAIRRLMLLMLLHEPERAPVSFMELYSSRATVETRAVFRALYEEMRTMRAEQLPQLAALHPIASTDSHRVSGFLDADGEVRGWVPGEDFLFGLGAIDAENPTGNLWVPDDYPGADALLDLMDRCAT